VKTPLYPRQAGNRYIWPNFILGGELDNVAVTQMAAGDFRGIGVLDIAIADWATTTIFLNDGLGNFSPGAVFSPASYLLPGTILTVWGPTPIVSIAKANFLGTSNDQIVINVYGNLVIVTLDSEGNFASAQTQSNLLGTNLNLTYQYQADQFTIANLNGDGFDDIVYSTIPHYPEYTSPQQVWVSYSQGGTPGNISFPDAINALTNFYTDTTAIGVGMADITGDGFLDLIATDSGRSLIDIWARTSDSIAQSPVEYIIEPVYQIQVYTTFNFGYFYLPEDARLGKSVVASTLDSGVLELIINSGGIDLQAATRVSPFVFPPQFASSYTAGTIAIVVFFNLPEAVGTASFDLTGELYQLDTISNDLNQAVITGDFNGDGNPDFAVVRNDSSGSVVGF
jgi:hypothetical protein